MFAFKKIESYPVVEKNTEIIPHSVKNFRFLSNLYWPLAEYGQNLDFDPPGPDYPVWPSLNYSTSSFIYQNPESTKYFVDFYEGNVIPVNEDAFFTYPEGDFSYSFYIRDASDAITDYTLYFVPTQKRLFSVAWAHYAGSGGFDSSFGSQQTYPTKAIYNQAKMLLNETGSNKFKINDQEVDHFFMMTFDQKNISGSISPNSFVLPLKKMSDLADPGDETWGPTYTFTDATQQTLYSTNFGYYSYLVSGNLNEISSSEVFGTIYYDHKCVILNTQKLEKEIFYSSTDGSYIYTGSIVGNNTNFYLTASQASNSYMLGRLIRNSQFSNTGGLIDSSNPLTATDFQFNLKNETVETIYFLNIETDEFNYTNNPSYFETQIYDINSGLYGGKIKYPDFVSNPVTYITSIGLYNDYGELLAIAKFRYPIKKDFSKRYSFKIKLKY